MNRTRLIFFIVLALCLVILAVSLTDRVLNAAALLQIFVASTVFAVGVVALDFFGLLGHHGDTAPAGTAGHMVDGGASHGLATDIHVAGDHDAGGAHNGVAAHSGAAPAAGHPAGHAGAAAPHGPGHAEHAEHADDHETRATGSRPVPVPGQGAAPILSILAYLRLLVYFCLGFGPAGWAGMVSGLGPLRSLLLAVPVGLAALLLARAFFRFQRRDTGSVAPEIDLLGASASVVVPLDDKTMGKIRVQAGMNVTDLYALAADTGAGFQRGDVVRIVQVDEECVHVR